MRAVFIAMAAVVSFGAASAAFAQTQNTRRSIGFGVGRTSMDCSTCGGLKSGDPWNGGWGASGYFSAGYWMAPKVRLAGEVTLWEKRSFSQRRDATVVSAAAVLHYHPIDALDLTAGAGPAAVVLAGGPGYISSSGWAFIAGAAYERRLRGTAKWAPYIRLVRLRSAAALGDNRGTRVLGPADPSSAQVGLGFRWN